MIRGALRAKPARLQNPDNRAWSLSDGRKIEADLYYIVKVSSVLQHKTASKRYERVGGTLLKVAQIKGFKYEGTAKKRLEATGWSVEDNSRELDSIIEEIYWTVRKGSALARLYSLEAYID